MRLRTITTLLGKSDLMWCFAFCSIRALSLAAEPPAASEDPAALPQAPPITCTIRSDPTCKAGSAPAISVEIANWTDHDIYLIGSLDGSDLKLRYPLCYFEVIGPNGPIASSRFRDCGNMNSIREQDFVKVRPGERFDPYQRIDDYGFFGSSQITPATFSAPGKYRIRFIYSTDKADAKYWLGDSQGNRIEVLNSGSSEEAIVELLAQVPKTTVSSNEIAVEVAADAP